MTIKIDLDGILTPDAIARLRKKETRAKAKAKKAKNARPQKPKPQPAVPRPSPWQPTARVLVLSHIICEQCGSAWDSPASPEPLVRLINTRTGALHELADHPARYRSDLPHEIRYIHGSCSACAHCWQGPATYGEEDNPQQELEFTWDTETPH